MTDQEFEAFAGAVGAAIKHYRTAAGMTQEDVAYEADLSIRHYQAVEAGKMNLRLSSLYSIARAVAVGPNVLMNRAAKTVGRPKKV